MGKEWKQAGKSPQPKQTMSVSKFLTSPHATAFSFEILPPVRGKSIEAVYQTIERLLPYAPAYINITTHRTECIYHELENGTFERLSVVQRPGSVAIAAALRARYGLPTVPHLICSGFTRADIESQLFDLSFLDITDLVVLRGDRAHDEKRFVPTPGGHEHAIDLCRQVNNFNEGRLIDGLCCDPPSIPFTYGVAGYPEKHDEAMNLASDIAHVVEKVNAGAKYVVTQMFFDNKKYFAFVKALREAGVFVPVVPGIKPLTVLNHRFMLPKTFHIDYPADLATALKHCQTNDDVKCLGVEWAIQQAKELKDANVPSIHFYSMNAAASLEKIAKAVF